MKKNRRNANIELLRIVSMIMVTFLHALGKSDLLCPMGSGLPLNGWIAWIFEALSLGAVNIFMLITGYFLTDSTYKIRRLIELVSQTLFYSFGTFVIFALAGLLTVEEKTIYGLLHYVFPVHMDVFWFVTAYIVLYMMLPLIVNGLKGISQKEHGTIIVLLLIYQCFVKSILPLRFIVDDKGYSFLWYLTVAMIGSYFKLYGFKHLTSSIKGWIAYFIGVLLLYIEILAIYLVYEKTGKLQNILEISMEYNHLFNLLLSIGIFSAFVCARPIGEKASRIICLISPYTLGVYLFQENMLLRYRWQFWFGLHDSISNPVLLFIGRLLFAVLSMFVLGIAVDFVRSVIFKGIYRLFCGRNK